MNHTLKTMLAAAFLLSAVIYIGFILMHTEISRLFGDNHITGAAIAEDCVDEECLAPPVGCTGQTGHACTIACYSDDDCDDTIAATDDLCRNPGTEYSICVNKPEN